MFFVVILYVLYISYYSYKSIIYILYYNMTDHFEYINEIIMLLEEG